MYNYNAKEVKNDAVGFKFTHNPVDNETNYTILFNGVDIYEVTFIYNTEKDSISILFYDRLNSISKHEYVKLMTGDDSHFLICDNKPNIWPINDTTAQPYNLLFGINHPDSRYITLYQFHAVEGVQTQFILQHIPKDMYDGHYKAVQDKKTSDYLIAKRDSSIARLKRDMRTYKDSVKNSIETKENNFKLKGPSQLAITELQDDYAKKMDGLIIGYFKNVYSFSNESFDVHLTFNCNGYGHISIDTAQDLSFQNGPQKNWLRDSLIRVIKPEIENGVYKTNTLNERHPDLKINFLKWYKKRLADDDRIADSAVFAETKKQIIDELNTYKTRTYSVPTKYSYTFNYTSTVKYPTWKYVNENDGTDKFIDKSRAEERIEITENLKRIFRDKFAAQGNGKYILKVCTLSVKNGAFEGQDIQIMEKK